jgi:hypothetical protein
VESLFTAMGSGCTSVRRGTTADGKIEVLVGLGRTPAPHDRSATLH